MGNRSTAQMTLSIGVGCVRVVSYMSQPFYYWKPNRGTPWVQGWVGPLAGLGIRRKDNPLVLLVFETRLLCFPTHSLVTISTELSSFWFTNYLVLIVSNLRLQAGFITAGHPYSVNYNFFFTTARFLGLILRHYIPHKSLFSTTLQNMSSYTIIIKNSETAIYEHQACCSFVGCDVACFGNTPTKETATQNKSAATFISTVITRNRIVMLLYHTFCLKFHVTAFHSQ